MGSLTMAGPRELLDRFVTAGALVFDIGAHVGLRTQVFLEMGCRVIAVEPQDAERAAIPAEAVRIGAAVSDEHGLLEMHVASGQTYMSTVERSYPDDVQAHDPVIYDRDIWVAAITLDDLIEAFGVPGFCKIDVEGHERAVLVGLTQPLPALSFEVHDFDPVKADDCIASLEELGRYEYLYSPRESFTMQHWPCELDKFGDVYAWLP